MGPLTSRCSIPNRWLYIFESRRYDGGCEDLPWPADPASSTNAEIPLLWWASRWQQQRWVGQPEAGLVAMGPTDAISCYFLLQPRTWVCASRLSSRPWPDCQGPGSSRAQNGRKNPFKPRKVGLILIPLHSIYRLCWPKSTKTSGHFVVRRNFVPVVLHKGENNHKTTLYLCSSLQFARYFHRYNLWAWQISYRVDGTAGITILILHWNKFKAQGAKVLYQIIQTVIINLLRKSLYCTGQKPGHRHRVTLGKRYQMGWWGHWCDLAGHIF